MMSHNMESPVVCQIPDCATTQAEIEGELTVFLNGFCSICKKDRAGELCGCAFPCSLTFRAQMMNKIHELLGLERPPDRRSIQVCFKHPDLLKQAREALVAKRDRENVARLKGSGGFTGGFGLGHVGRQKQKGNSGDRQENEDDKGGGGKMTTIRYGSVLNVGDRAIVVGGDYVPRESRQRCLQDNKAQPSLCDEQRRQEASVKRRDRRVGGDSEEAKIVLKDGPSQACQATMTVSKSHRKTLKFQYSNYGEAILATEIFTLKGQSFLNDVSFVCQDGTVQANSLLLGAMSPFMRGVLSDVFVTAAPFVVIMPDVDVKSMEVFLSLLFDKDCVLNAEQPVMQTVYDIAKLFQIKALMSFESNSPCECHDKGMKVSNRELSPDPLVRKRKRIPSSPKRKDDVALRRESKSQRTHLHRPENTSSVKICVGKDGRGEEDATCHQMVKKPANSGSQVHRDSGQNQMAGSSEAQGTTLSDKEFNDGVSLLHHSEGLFSPPSPHLTSFVGNDNPGEGSNLSN